MGYDLQRAALVTCCLSALLLAASLMPAAGLGSYPTLGGPSSGDAVTAPDSAPDPADDGPVTTPEETTEEATTTEPESTRETTTPEETTAAAESDSGGDGDGSSSGVAGAFAGLFASLLLAGLLVVGLYTGGIALGSVLLGYQAVAWLPFSGTITSVPTLTMSTLIGAAGVTGSFVGQLRSVLSGVAEGGAALARVPAELGRVLRVAVTGPARALTGLAGAAAGIGSLFGALSNLSLGFSRRGSHTEAAATATDARERGEGPTPESGSDDPPPEPTSVADAFDRMTDRLPVGNREAKTPAELADAAVERGWPSGPVQTLTRLFREVRYGGQADDTERTTRAASAWRRLHEFWRGSE